MIKEIIMYTVICDGCGVDVNKDAEYAAWNDKPFVEDNIWESGWIEEGGKHYCPKCFSYDDDDNLVLKNKK